MKQSSVKLTIAVVVCSMVIFYPFSLTFENDNASFHVTQRSLYENFINHHPYSNKIRMNKKELKKIPRNARPDLAYQQDYRRTLDPSLGYPPYEKLQKTYEQTRLLRQQILNNRSTNPTWTERGPDNVGGRTRAIMFDPNDVNKKKVWAGGVTGGLWYTNDITVSNASWTKVNDFWDNIAISCITYDPNNPQIFYVGTGERWANMSRGAGVWKSTDGGQTWNRLGTTSGYYYVTDIIVRSESGTSILYVGVDLNYYQGVWHGSVQGIYRSFNNGISFSQVLPKVSGTTQNYSPNDIKLGADNRIYVGSNKNPYGDGGGTILYSDIGTSGNWTVAKEITSGERVELANAPSNANIVYALVESNSQLESVLYSSDRGVTWTAKNEPDDADPNIFADDFTRNQADYDLVIAVDPNNANTIYAGGIDLFKSTNNGTSWTQVSHWYGGFGYPDVHADQHSIVFQPGSSSKIVFGNDGGIFYTANGNLSSPSFIAKNDNYNVTQFYSAAMSPTSGSNEMLAGAQDNGTQQFSQTGLGSTTEAYGGDGAFCFIDQNNPTYQIVSYVYNTYYLSDDGGASFFTNLVDDENSGSFINPSDYDDREKIFYSAYSTTEISRIKNITSTPGVATPVTIIGLGTMASHIRVSPYSTNGTSTVFIGTEGGKVFKVTNAHLNPTVTEKTGTSFPSGSISCIELGTSENEILVTYFNYGVTSVWETKNAGVSWVNKEGNLPDMPVRWALYNPMNLKEVLLATEIGVWATNDISVASPVWFPATNGLANVRVDMLQYRSSDNTVMASTFGRGVFTSSNCFSLPVPAPIANFNSNQTNILTGQSASFTDLSTNNPSSWQWSFTGGTPASSNLQNPINIIYSAPGCYQVSLTVSNTNGSDSETKTCYINVTNQVSEICDTLFQYSVPQYYINNGDQTLFTINPLDNDGFTPNSSLTNVGYTTGWDVPSEVISPGDTNYYLSSVSWFQSANTADNWLIFGPLTIPDKGGMLQWKHKLPDNSWRDGYRVLACSTGSQISNFTTGGILLKSYSDNDPLTDGDTLFRGDSVLLSAPTYGGKKVYFAFHHNATDMFLLCLDDIYVSGCSTGGSLPTAQFTYSNNGLTTYLTDQSSGNDPGWLWNFGDTNTSTVQNPVHTYSQNGNYKVCLTVSNTLGSDSTCRNISVALPPKDSCLKTLTAPMDRSSKYGVEFIWQNGNHGLAQRYDSLNGEIRSIVFFANVYTGNVTDFAKVTIYQESNGLPGNILASNTVLIDSIVNNQKRVVYFQNPVTVNGNVIIAIEATDTINDLFYVYRNDTASDGMGLQLSLINQNGKWFNNLLQYGNTRYNFDFIILPEISYDIKLVVNKTDDYCGDGNGKLSAIVTGGVTPYSFSWSNQQTSQSLNNLATGNYSLTATDSNGCSIQIQNIVLSKPPQMAVNAFSSPASAFTVRDGKAYVLVSGGTPPYKYLWNDSLNQVTDTALNLLTGKYLVLVTDSNGCILSDTITVGFITILNDKINDDRFICYPLPVTDKLFIELNLQNEESGIIRIFDMNGKVIWGPVSKKIGNIPIQIETGDWDNGNYLLEINGKDKAYKKMIQKSK